MLALGPGAPMLESWLVVLSLSVPTLLHSSSFTYKNHVSFSLAYGLW